MTGPLTGLRIVEFAGIGPAPFAGMMLTDAGADIIRIDRHDRASYPPQETAHLDLMNRGRRSVAVDLKNPDGVALALRLIDQADGLMEGFRPGVAERLGIGPEVCMKRNPRLVYGRMTGWGQTGPLAETAGHDIDYISIAGALESIGRAGQPPLPPLNLIGDFGGGGMLMAFGMVAAILSAQKTGEGQVVDAAMVDGAAALMTMIYTFRSMGIWQDVRGTNLLDTGAPFYEVYETSDGKFMSVGAIEPQFYAELIRLLELEDEALPDQNDKSQWPQMKERFATLFLTKTRDEWQAIFDGTDACVSPVLSIPEASHHPHNQHRGTFTEVAGVIQPAPAPRFEGTPGAIRRPPPNPGQYGDEALTDWGIDSEQIAKMRSAGAIT